MSKRTTKEKSKHGKRANAHQPVLDRADLERIVSELACTVAPADVTALLEREDEFRQRIAALDSTFALLQRQLTLLLDCLRDHAAGRIPQVPYATVAHAAAAMLYFGSEWDLLPDFLPRIGRLDDAAIVAIACERVAEGLRRYARATGRPWRGIVPTRAANAARPC